MRHLLISTALCLGLATGASAQGVPTVDTQNIAQEIRQLQQMLEDFGIQSDIFENALEQLDVLQQQFDQLRPVADQGQGRGIVTSIRYLGAGSRVALRIGEAEVAALVPAGQTVPEQGAEVAIAFDPAALHVMEG